MYKPIRDYAIIGNLRSAALVSKDGSIDWAPAPFIDSATIFAALLDDKKGGRWSIQPVGEFKSEQKYLRDTNVVITSFTTKKGSFDVIDCIAMEKDRKTLPKEQNALFEINRRVVCTSGSCKVRVIFNPHLEYAKDSPEIRIIEGKGLKIRGKRQKAILVSRARYTVDRNTARATFTLKEGEEHYFIFRYNQEYFPKIEASHYGRIMRRTQRFWEDWVHRCDLKTCPIAGPWHDSAVRSSLVLKVLFFEPVGTIAAAPTTSLPEEIGGVRNWDYRFTWVRDSVFALQALFWLGYIEEANTYVRWVMHLAKNRPENLQIMYGLRGEKELTEEFLPHLEGYKKSKPVRVGNAAYRQKQWDIYGSIFDTVWRLHSLKKEHVVDKEMWNTLRALANYVVTIWRDPDEGLWEVRGGKRHFVYSKVMCWVALDRALKLQKAYNFKGEDEVWEKEKNAIRAEVMEKGWSAKKKAFTQSFNSNAVDASVLLLPTTGFIAGTDPKMISTIRRVEADLAQRDGLLLRYTTEDGLPGQEGAFLLASFWLVDALVFAKKRVRAEQIFKKLISASNHVGLFSEEINPKTKEFLGNFPQAYTHIGLINSAFYLARARTKATV